MVLANLRGITVLSDSDGPHVGRPVGGVAILWRTALECALTEVKLGLDWAVGVKITSNSGKEVILISVYLPYNCRSNDDEFLCKLHTLSDVAMGFDTTNFVLVGDFS